MKYFILFLIIIVFPFGIFAQDGSLKGMGLIFDDVSYQKAPRLSPALRFSDENIPSAYSLRKFCPTAGDQGYMGSCVSWSTGYAALTISYAVKNNLTSQNEIDKHAKSALFIYNQLKRSDESSQCDVGLNIENTMQWLVRNGDCDFYEFNPKSCNIRPSEEIRTLAQNLPIEDYNTLFNIGDTYERKVSAIINSISQNKPVIAGFITVKSFKAAQTTGIWKPRAEEEPTGGHAMCIVGYDNKSQQFEILNSWGTDFANKGFFKMSYRDLSDYCKYGYNLKLGYTREELAKMLNLTGSFYFKKFVRYNEKTDKREFVTVNPFLSGNYYTFKEGNVKKDDFYRLAISSLQKDSYLYAFSLKPDHSFEILFPLSASDDPSKVNDIPLVPASNATVELPADESKAYSTDMVGDDVLCLLYSNQKIQDIKAIATSVNKLSGDLFERLQKVLGSRMIPINKITYRSSEMSFSTLTSQGTIVPIILKVTVTQ